MLNLAAIDENKDLITKEYVDSKLIPSGGTSGQVLAKSSGTDYDVGWATPSGGGAVTGVKGDAESTYRTGNVNITLANIGAAAETHYHDRLHNPESSSALHRAVITTSDNLRIDNRASTSDEWALYGYCAVGTQAPGASAYRVANQVFATPDGSDGLGSMRALVNDDLPAPIDVAHGGTGQTSVANARAYLSCKQLFNSTAATSVTLSESAANFKFLVVKLAINSGKSKYHYAIAQSATTSEFTCSIKDSTSSVYFKGGELVSSTTTLKVQNLWAVHASSTNTTGVESESNTFIKQVWGIR